MTIMPSSAQAVPQVQPARPKVTRDEEPDVVVCGTVRAPIFMVWNLFRPFGPEIMRWWPIYEWVRLEPPGRDDIGAVRHFKANGRVYRERLVLRDDNTYTEQYEFVDSNVPIPIRSVLTTIRMRSVGNLETEVTWSSKTDVNPLFLPLIRSTQRQAYYKAIESLSRYFNPATELLELLVVGGRIPRPWGVMMPSAYVAAHVGDAAPVRTSLRPLTTRPKWNEHLQFNVGVLDRTLGVSVWSATFGKDILLGSASLDIPTSLSSEWMEQTVQLEGPSTGQVTLALRRKPEFQVLRDTMSLAKTLGSRFGRLVPPLRQLGFEIEMLDTAVANIEVNARDYLSQTFGVDLRPSTNGQPGNVAGTLLLDLRRAASGVQRTIEGLTGQFLALSQQVVESIQEGQQPVYAYDRYPRSPQLPDVPLENLPRMVRGLPIQELLPPSKLGGMVQRGLDFVFAQFDLPERYKRALIERKDPFQAFFSGAVKRNPAIVDHWKDDTEFCRQLIQGVNPLVIRRVHSLSEIPAAMLGLSAQGKSLEELMKEQRLFILDYAELAKLKLYRNMVFYAPVALVYRELLGEGQSRLNLVGIQLTRNEGANVVYTATGSPPNRYLYAKIQVACADNQYHQFISHLGLAHLAVEPFVIAHRNAFGAKKDHPIGALLAPHMQQTIGINYLARQTLVAAQHAFTDETFAPGTAQALQLFLGAWEKYDFMEHSFPEELAARGFDEAASDGVQDYYYRDDGFKIWHALESYVGEVVEAVYADDEAVAADTTLQQWVLECYAEDRADIPGFPRSITTRALLGKVLTTLIFHASAFHSAVNFPQFDYITYVPNRPDSTFAKMPEGEEDISLDFILLKAMPNFFVSSFQISFALLLTVPPDQTLANLEAPTPELKEAHARFQARLREITNVIGARNEKLVAQGMQPYPYLMPERIAASVAI